MIVDIKEAAELVKQFQKRNKLKGYVLTGAGVSRASNIPTFRGEDGLWERYDFEEVATLEAWVRNPKKIWKMYQEGIELILQAKPNATHKAIVALEEVGLIQEVITQNADSLHQKAGSSKVLEVHGNLTRVKCISCGKTQQFTEPPKIIPPYCDCGGMLRPDVVLFHELLPEKEIAQAFRIASKADLAFVIGTSAEVVPAATLPSISKANGAKILVFNPEKTDHVDIADVFIQGPSEITLPLFIKELKNL